MGSQLIQRLIFTQAGRCTPQGLSPGIAWYLQCTLNGGG